MAQTGVTQITKSIINDYRKVTSINTSNNRVTYSGASIFKQRDTVLLIQMTGIQTGGTIENTGAGLYEFHIVESITGSNTVTLKSTPGSFNTSELVQIVRVPSYKNAAIAPGNTLQCGKWNWAAGTGGVLALMVEETLTLNGDINVSGLGFNGGAESVAYTGACSFNAPYNFPNYPKDASNRAGNKGEGAVTTSYFNPGVLNDSIRGFGRTVNGGGGGNGKWSGGGGGANVGTAGNGGDQACGSLGYTEDTGNNGAAITYTNINMSERAFMGGGGGAGTGVGTAGGNGGGIVIIVAQKIKFESNTAIKANGGSVSGMPSNAGAGGGGGGGSILLSAEDYSGIRAEIIGGDGGSVNRGICEPSDLNTANSRGVGGGGGGGLLLTTIDMSNEPTVKNGGGAVGRIINSTGGTCPLYGWYGPGQAGKCYGNFQVQMRGFLRNYIVPASVDACPAIQKTIDASHPQGGTGSYTYLWQTSPNGTIGWTDITDSDDEDLTYAFSQDTWVRRRVTSGSTIDNSSPIKVTVGTAIDNTITPAETTLCWMEDKFVIEGNPPSEGGGGGPYTIQWQQLISEKWDNLKGETDINLSVSLPVSDATQTLTYRRKVTSSKNCVSEGNTSVIHVQPVIKGNTISPGDQRVCGDHAQELTGPEPTGGTGTGSYRYYWQVKIEGMDWTNLGNPVADADYQPILNTPQITSTNRYQERSYQRYVTSGTCNSTSNPVTVRFDQQSSPSVITTGDQVGDNALKYQFSEELVAVAPAVGTGIWSSMDERISFNPSGESTTTVSNLQFGINTITWTVSNNTCSSEPASVKIEVIDVRIPNGFSPNGDGINDCFRIEGGENATSCEVTVIDRYNNVVFESKSFKGVSDPDNCSGWWDGRTSSGKELPTGTYFYKLTLNGDKVYKGYVVLKKQ